MLKKIICLFFLFFITSTSLYGGWKWNVAKTVTKGALVVGAKKVLTQNQKKKLFKKKEVNGRTVYQRDISAKDIVELLKPYGENLNVQSFNNKISRGGFSSVFF